MPPASEGNDQGTKWVSTRGLRALRLALQHRFPVPGQVGLDLHQRTALLRSDGGSGGTEWGDRGHGDALRLACSKSSRARDVRWVTQSIGRRAA